MLQEEPGVNYSQQSKQASENLELSSQTAGGHTWSQPSRGSAPGCTLPPSISPYCASLVHV